VFFPESDCYIIVKIRIFDEMVKLIPMQIINIIDIDVQSVQLKASLVLNW